MPISIKDQSTEDAIRAASALTEKGITETVKEAILLLTKSLQKNSHPSKKENLLNIARRATSLPVLDKRTPDEILGYDKDGLPK